MKISRIICLLSAIILITACSSSGAKKLSAPEAYYAEQDMAMERSSARAPASPQRTSGAEPPAESEATALTPERMIIYTADYSITVTGVQSAIKRVEGITGQFKGRVENLQTFNSYRSARIVIRVPAAEFHRAVEELEKIGTVTSKNINASDVTEKYTDMSIRMKSLQTVHERLLSLLSRTTKPDDKVAILKEITRIRGEIEQLRTSMEYYAGMAAYSTITINLRTEATGPTVRYIPSPFPWIQRLDPGAMRSAYSKRWFRHNDIEGFFKKEKEFSTGEDPFLFVNPGASASVRIGLVNNYPRGDKEFWEEALKTDFNNRLFRMIETFSVEGSVTFTVIGTATGEGRIYLLAFSLQNNHIILSEALFTDEDSYKKNRELYVSFLKKLEYRKPFFSIKP